MRSSQARGWLCWAALWWAAIAWAWYHDPAGCCSLLALTQAARWAGFLGLVLLAWQLQHLADQQDPASGAYLALAASLTVGLAPGLGGWTAPLAALAVVVVLNVSVARLGQRLGSSWVAGLLPLAVVPAVLPDSSARLAPPQAVAFSGAGGSWPAVAAAWLLGLLAAALLAPRLQRQAPATRQLLAAAAAGVIWGLLGWHWAGLYGPATRVAVWPAACGWALVRLTAGDDRPRWGLGGLAVLALATALNAAEPQWPAAGLLDGRGPALLSGLLLLLAALRAVSADAREADQHTVGGAAAGIGDDDADPPLLPGPQVADGDGAGPAVPLTGA
ncbi:MAG: hypothetical protein IT204_03605 [Fimbriimonadaceae bacterium]|nr:hypothetical protein [Fimbriimonadaceae bacterium]